MVAASDEPVAKRLHVSGLTAQISYDDLVTRFSSFGKVKALDGFGKLDANGDRRPYAHLTLESTKGQLARCLNLLSGTIWKGAKLRIGEAKPDYRERIELENRKQTIEPPRKRRRLLRGCQGVFSSDMSLVTSSNYITRSLWRKTPLGQLIRPMRMRPLRPLPPVPSQMSGGQQLASVMKKKLRRRKKEKGIVRQRRKLIDPELWGSEYLKGVMLESSSGVILPERREGNLPEQPTVSPAEESFQRDTGHERIEGEQSYSPSPSPSSPSLPSAIETQRTSNNLAAVRSPPQEFETTGQSDLAREAAQSLSFLTTIFGNANDEGDWGGTESLSDVDMEADAPKSRASRPTVGRTDEDDDLEIVPRAKSAVKANLSAVAITEIASDEIEEVVSNHGQQINEEQQGAPIATPTALPKTPAVQLTKLKDMFAPQEQDVGFSILGNLDIDLELDETVEIPVVSQPIAAPSFSYHAYSAPVNQISDVTVRSTVTLDTTKPLFFPLDSSLTSAHTIPPVGRGKGPKDIISIFHEQGWTANAFCRTESADEIRKRWEDCKVELTREWKRRHREAVKAARRRGGLHD